jgi:hypothetical protein
MAFSVAGVFFVRRMKWHPLLEESNQFAGYVYSTIGLIYGVFLAFTVIVVWQEYSEADKCVANEVSNVSMLWRDAQVIPEPTRTELQERLIVYSREVINSEWATMGHEGWKSKAAGDAYQAVWDAYYKYKPQTQQEILYYQETLHQLNELGIQRRLRLMHSRSGLPLVIWLFLIFGAIVTMVFPFMFWTKHARIQATMVALLSGLIVSSLFMTFSLQHPFTGSVSIKPDAYEVLLSSLEERKAQSQENPK